MRIKTILNHPAGLALEFFAPKTEKGVESLFENIQTLKTLSPAYVSVTYGAGGTSRNETQAIVKRIAREEGLTVMAHLTCVGHTREEIRSIVEDYRESGIENIMALRGDLPRDGSVLPGQGDFPRAIDLVRFLREEFGDHFSIGGAAFPETHPESCDLDFEIRHFKTKAEAGLDFAVTQLFFDNRSFFDFVDASRKAGITIPIVPGIMPITSYQQIEKFTQMSQASLPAPLREKLEKYQNDPEGLYRAGIDHSIRQCRELAEQGFRFFHFFTLNKAAAPVEIYSAVRETGA